VIGVPPFNKDEQATVIDVPLLDTSDGPAIGCGGMVAKRKQTLTLEIEPSLLKTYRGNVKVFAYLFDWNDSYC
jgi:hypothetical protein